MKLNTIENIIIVFVVIIYLITLPISYPIIWIINKLPNKVELNPGILLYIRDEIYCRQQNGEFIPSVLTFTSTVGGFKYLSEQINELMAIQERYKKYQYCVDVNEFKYLLSSLEIWKNEMIKYKEAMEHERYSNLKYEDYINKALEYYNEWNKEGFDNIMIRYHKELKEIEILSKKLSLNDDFK